MENDGGAAGRESGAPARVRVELGERSYDILVGPGLIERAGAELAAVFPAARAAVITDRNVAELYLENLLQSLSAAGITAIEMVLPPGEATKSFPQLQAIVDRLLDARFERGDVVVALGGGVVGDIAGFAAAIVRRGMGFVQVPTTLLAQVDSSVGGKTGINTRQGKNLVGAFKQPNLVLADTAALDSLPVREFRAGYAETVKYGLINDIDFFTWLEANREGVFAGGPARAEAITTSCRAKAAVVAADECEAGHRALLNLGHTFGHALEAALGYGSRLVHGEAVAIGMVLALRYSVRLGIARGQDAERVAAHLAAAGLPTEIASLNDDLPGTDELMRAIAQDKKVRRGRLSFVLVRGIGAAFIADGVEPADIAQFLEDERKR